MKRRSLDIRDLYNKRRCKDQVKDGKLIKLQGKYKANLLVWSGP